MNTRIFSLVMQNLKQSFSLPKYSNLEITKDTDVSLLPFTPARKEKFAMNICKELDIEHITLSGTVEEFVQSLDTFYMNRFFGEIWKPNTDNHSYSGWSIIDRINKQSPKNVLDFGCGYNQFKGRINNLTGIDPYNNNADYMIDILEFNVNETYDHIIVFGSLNFGDEHDIRVRFNKLYNLLDDQGRMYFRVNPGILWPKGPYVDIFPWSFEFAYNIAKEYNCKLENYKKDNTRVYFEILKM